METELTSITWGSILTPITEAGMKLLGGLVVLLVGLFLVKKIKNSFLKQSSGTS